MLRVTPTEFLSFARSATINEATIELTNTVPIPIIYKIQTTSPEKFRVRPRYGLLNPDQTVSVSILLKDDFQLAEAAKDKFLVMGIAAPGGDVNISPQLMMEIWKEIPTTSPEIEQHRLCCIYNDDVEAGIKRNDRSDRNERSERSMRNMHGEHGERGERNASERSSIGESGESGENSVKPSGNLITDLDKHAKQLEKQLRCTQILQCLTLVFLLILSAAVVYLLKLQSDGAGELSCEEAARMAAAKAAAAQAASAGGSCPAGRHH